ncbi:hypothetical protein ILUMI_06032 [Ignelater luminosus]|uniref:Peptidase S1 domain-containing protein n=1 Tax=Ignelater luminosus TaxID=2038154 RepID=A0A8K0GD02_IGNLU|nr:hypothetical protein ILUMI_06032 [Ignelater luminosus]
MSNTQMFALICNYFHIAKFFIIVTLIASIHNRRTPDYGFVAYLFCKHNFSHKCTGAIVASKWILNYCEYGSCVYDAVRVGVSKKVHRIVDFTYDIDNRIVHPGYFTKQFPQINDKYDLRYLYAAKHAVFLDRTAEEMRLIKGLVRPIVISRSTGLPPDAKTIFFPKADHQRANPLARFKTMAIVDNQLCNSYYKKYNLQLEGDFHYCVDSSQTTYEECCGGNAIMEYSNRLIGVVAWSTACWSPPEPWVFTSIGMYYKWITNITGYDPIFTQDFPINKKHKRSKKS